MSEVTELVSDRAFVNTGKKRSATRGFDVTGLAAGDREDAAISEMESAYPSAAYNAGHPEDTSNTLVVESQEPEMVSPGHWRILVRYTEAKGGAHVDKNENKLDRPARIGYDFGVRNQRVDRDVDGNPILVSSGNAPNPAPQAVRPTFGLTVLKWEPFFDANLAAFMLGSVNSDELIVDGVTIVSAGSAMLVEMAPTHNIEFGMPQVEVRYRWRLEPPLTDPPADGVDPFWASLLDQDYEAKAKDDDGNATEAQIFDPGDPPTPVNRPVRLNGLGVPMNAQLQLGDGDGLERNPLSSPPSGAEKGQRGSGDTQATFLWYQVQKKRSVARLGLE